MSPGLRLDVYTGSLRELDNDKRLKELLAKWTEEYKVVVNEDNLKKVKLPVRTEDQIKKNREKKDEVTKS